MRMAPFEYSVWTIAFICAGVFIASLVDAIGGGGGLISVPVYLVAGLPAHQALGTNKLSASIGTAASAFRYAKNGCVNWRLALPAVAFALAGAHLGTRLQLMVDERYIKYLLIAVLPVVAVVMFKQKQLPEEPGKTAPWLQQLIVWAASLIIGVYDGFYGPGTGTFLLLVYCHLARLDVRTSSGTVKFINLASNIGAMITSLAAGQVLVPVGIVAAFFSVAGHYIGAGLTIKNGAKIVRPFILAVLVLLAAKVFWEAFAG